MPGRAGIAHSVLEPQRDGSQKCPGMVFEKKTLRRRECLELI